MKTPLKIVLCRVVQLLVLKFFYNAVSILFYRLRGIFRRKLIFAGLVFKFSSQDSVFDPLMSV